MANKLLLLIVAMLPVCTLRAEEAAVAQLTLEECKTLARDNYPSVKQYELISQTRDYTLENAAKAWLPQVSVTMAGLGVTDLLDASPAMKQAGLSTKNWLATGSVMVRQTIYDGGMISAKKSITAAGAEVDKRQLDVALYELNERIEQLYFGILMLDAQIRLSRTLQEDLNVSSRQVAAMIKGGMANQSDLDLVKVALLKSQQAQDAQQASRKAYLLMLGAFVGKTLSETVELQMPPTPSAQLSWQNSTSRPEMRFFEAQKQLVERRAKALDSQLRPTVSAFGLGAYHTKVSDMVKPGMLSAGIMLSWNIGALYTRKKDKHLLDLQRQMIASNQATFLFNNRLQSQSTSGNVAAAEKQLAKDEEIIALRTNIRQMSEKKVQLGLESVNELLRNVNAVNEAQQQKAIHEIQLVKEFYRLKNNQGL